MHADAYPHRDTWQVPQLEGPHEVQDVQRHVADIHSVSVSVSLGKSRGHHVGVPDCLHLNREGKNVGVLPVGLTVNPQFVREVLQGSVPRPIF